MIDINEYIIDGIDYGWAANQPVAIIDDYPAPPITGVVRGVRETPYGTGCLVEFEGGEWDIILIDDLQFNTKALKRA